MSYYMSYYVLLCLIVSALMVLFEELLMKRLASEPRTTLQSESFSVETRCACGGAISHEETTVLQWSAEKKRSDLSKKLPFKAF